ncbi:MAG: 3-hydroxyacyl-CoA dehydrogenase NAD-binding domain-containing protein [Xanthobacteraceae bacterium]
MTKQRIGVLGGGLMGHGIAYLFAAAGHPVGIFEPAAPVRDAIPARLEAIRKLLDGDAAILPRIAIGDRLADAVTNADVVIEAAPEKLDLKQKIFAEVEALVAPDTILASNSSALRPTDIGRGLVRRDRMIGTHFWNPPHLVPLVEVIETEVTSAATVEATMRLMRGAGKSPCMSGAMSPASSAIASSMRSSARRSHCWRTASPMPRRSMKW